MQPLETKACRPCAAAKRKCTREQPLCARCHRQGIDCQYPPSKPSAFVLVSQLGADDPKESLPLVKPFSSLPLRTASIQPGQLMDECYDSVRFIYTNPLVDRTLLSTWFSGPTTWQIANWPQTRHLYHPKGYNIKRLVAICYHWYVQWLHTTSNPFIHKEFYRHRFPRCTQDTSSTLASYLQRTPENTSSLLRLIDSRAEQLLADNGVNIENGTPISGAVNGSNIVGTHLLDTHDHIARIHALALYQLLALFAPKRKLRQRAEARIPILVLWMQDLINHAKTNIGYLNESLYGRNCLKGHTPPFSDDDQLWHAWILAESARRAFMIGTTVQSLYLVLRDGITASAAARHDLLGGGCAGGMPFTTRKGAWEADNAQQWARLAVEVDFGLTYVQQAKHLAKKFRGQEEWDVDTFANVFIRGTYGRVD